MDASSAFTVDRAVTRPPSTWWSRDLALPFEPWAALWALVLAMPWLLPTHMIPWRAFHADLLMALVVLPGALWAMSARRERVPLSPLALVVFGIACIPALQWAGGILLFAGDAWVVTAYLLGFALAIVTGARFQQVAPDRLADTLFAAFAIAGLTSVAIVLAQWLRLWPLRVADFDLIMHYPGPPGYRPFGNLGQPNHLATLLIWSLIAVCWAYLSRRLRGSVAFGAAAFLLVGIAATQSRTAWLQMVVLIGGAVLWRRTLDLRRWVLGLLGLALVALALVVGWEAINQALYLEAPRALSEEVSSPGGRPMAWQLFADAALRRPWVGWGWNQIPLAQSAVALDHQTLNYSYLKTHNLVLDLLVQLGLPLGLLLSAALVAWMVTKARRLETSAACLLWLAIAILGVHAMLEFPQDYAYFLLPAGLMMGVLEAMHPWGRPLHTRRAGPVSALLLAATLTCWIGVEYIQAEANLERLRFERAHVGPSRNSQAPGLVVLTQLREFLRALRLRPERGMTEEQLELMRRVTRQFPSDGNLLVLAAMEALNGRPDDAGRALALMCHMVPMNRCRDALSTWRQMAATSPPLTTVAVPAL